MSEIKNPLPEKQKSNVFKKAIKVKGYIELCEKNLRAADDKISFQSIEHRIIKKILEDIRSAESLIDSLIARTSHDTLTD